MEEENKRYKVTTVNAKLKSNYESLMKDKMFQEIAKERNLDPDSKNFKYDLKLCTDLYNERRYDKLIANSEFKKIADEVGLSKKNENFRKKLKEAEDKYYSQIRMNDYNDLMQHPEFEQIATEMGLDPKSKDFSKALKSAKKLYYKSIKKNSKSKSSTKLETESKDSSEKTNDDKHDTSGEELTDIKAKTERIEDKQLTDSNKKQASEQNLDDLTREVLDLANGKVSKESAERIAKSKSNAKNTHTTEQDLFDIINKAKNKNDKAEVVLRNTATLDSDVVEIDPSDVIVTGGSSKKISTEVKKKQQEYIDVEGIEKDEENNNINGIYSKNIERKVYTWDDLINNSDNLDKDDFSKIFNDAVNQRDDENDDNYNFKTDKNMKDFNAAKEKKREKLHHGDFEVIFNAKLGVYQILKDGELIKNEPPKKMSFFERRRFVKNINKKEGKFHSEVDVGKDVDPTFYEILKEIDDKYPLENSDRRSVEYLRALKDRKPNNLLTKFKYDLRGLDKQKDINIFDRARIKNLAKKHEQMGLAEVERDPELAKRTIFARVAAGVMALGVAVGAAGFFASRDKALEEGENTQTTMSDTANKNHGSSEIDETDKNEIHKADEKQTLNKTTVNDKEEIQVEEDIQDEIDKQEDRVEQEALTIGKEVTVDTDYLYYNCEGASPKCDLNKFMENNSNAKFILGRMAVRNADGYQVNTTTSEVSLEDLKEQYGEDAEYFCNFNVETPSGRYVDIGWTNVKNVKVKSQEKEKQNPWQVDNSQLNNQTGKSGTSRETEKAVKDTLKDAGIEVDF